MRDYVYVGDVVQANLLALNGRPGVYNVGTGRETSVKQLVAAFEQALGRCLAVKHEPPRAGEVGRIALDAGRASRVLGWQPRVDLADGVARTLAWFRDGAG